MKRRVFVGSTVTISVLFAASLQIHNPGKAGGRVILFEYAGKKRNMN